MRIFLTGGRGMVGRNFREHPSAAAHEILAPTSEELDLLDANAVEAWIKNHRPDMVVHTAGWVGGILANTQNPVRFLLDNIDMGCNVVRAAHRAGVEKLINLGSSCMYPRNISYPLTEDMILTGELEPTNEGYALAKIAVAKLCEYISRQFPDFAYKTLIPCNIFGRFDHFDPVRSHLIPAIIRKVHEAKVRGHADVEIWGDGTVRREFMYGGDLADAMAEAVERFDSLPPMMNVGLGYDYTVNEYYQAIADSLGFRGQFVYDLTKPVGTTHKLVSVQKQEEWGWKPTHDLASGIRQTYDYFLSIAA